MTRTETIKAFKELGGMATLRDLYKQVGSNQQHVVNRMIKWGEVRITKDYLCCRGGHKDVLELMI